MNARLYSQPRGWPLGSFVCDVSNVLVTFPYGIMLNVWYLCVIYRFLIFAFFLTLKYMNARTYIQPRGWPLGTFVCDVSCVFVTFPYGVMRNVWYLI